MDTYSYISENGTTRQIEDLIAKAKNEEQDARISEIENVGLLDFYKTIETETHKRWVDGKVVYRKCGVTLNPPQYQDVVLDSSLTNTYVADVVLVSGYAVATTGVIFPLTGYVGGNARLSLGVFANGLRYLSSETGLTKIFWVLEYTKA